MGGLRQRQPDNSVYAVNADTGAMLSTYQTNEDQARKNDVARAPTISAPGVNGLRRQRRLHPGKDKVTYALDLTTGSVLWQHALAVGTAATFGAAGGQRGRPPARTPASRAATPPPARRSGT